jgi:hypothetical protein
MTAADVSAFSGREETPASKLSISIGGRLGCSGRGMKRGTQSRRRNTPPPTKPEETQMSSDYDNTDRGALFRNEDKGEERHPDYRGSINVGGTEYWLSAWIRTSKKGTKYMSLSIKPKNADTAKPEINDGVPF